jgi:hypothetical protein
MAVQSLRNLDPGWRVLLVNDSGLGLKKLRTQIKIPSKTLIRESPHPRQGQWATFVQGVKAMGSRACFGLLHDDDKLLPGYGKTISRFGERQQGYWAATSNIVSMEQLPQKVPVLKTSGPVGPFRSSAELAHFYAGSFLPFPGTFFHLPSRWVLESLDPSYGIATDAALLINLADRVPVHFLPDKIYAYRRHPGQESSGFHHRMEDKFHSLLLNKARGSPWAPSTEKQLARRRAGRFFQASWERGTFRHHEFSTKFPFHLAFRAVRNRKWLAFKIGAGDLRAWWQEKTLFRGAPRMVHRPYGSREPEVHVIIFSRNRACQLDALLRSLRSRFRIPHQVSVLWKADPGLHSRSYAQIRKEYPRVSWHEEVNFRKDLLTLLRQKTPLVMLCTDDGLFHAPVVDIPWPESWDQVAAYSFRLGENCRYSHPANEHYRLPPRWRGAGVMVWDWTRARADFRYPFSLDAHIFPASRIRKMLAKLPFHNPNTLEDAGSRDPSLWERKWMAGPLFSKYVSLPVNRVNETHANRAGTAFQSDPNELARRYLAGHRIDLEKTVTSLPQGPHEEYVMQFSKGLAWASHGQASQKVTLGSF